MRLPDIIPTARLFLRAMQVEMAPELFRVFDANRERLRATTPVQADETKTEQAQVTRINELVKKREDGTCFVFALCLVESETLETIIGVLGVHHVSVKHQRGEIGYWIDGAHEGRGYMTEAVAALEQACFERGFHRLEIRCSSLNPRSSGIPTRLGYRLEGRLREHSREHHEWSDELLFAKLNGD